MVVARGAVGGHRAAGAREDVFRGPFRRADVGLSCAVIGVGGCFRGRGAGRLRRTVDAEAAATGPDIESTDCAKEGRRYKQKSHYSRSSPFLDRSSRPLTAKLPFGDCSECDVVHIWEYRYRRITSLCNWRSLPEAEISEA